MARTFEYPKGTPLATVGEIFDAMYAVFKRGDPEEARDFMAAYILVNKHAESNIGYLTGYCGAEEANAMREFFDVSHPIFGRTSPKTPTEALLAGAVAATGGPEKARQMVDLGREIEGQ